MRVAVDQLEKQAAERVGGNVIAVETVTMLPPHKVRVALLYLREERT